MRSKTVLQVVLQLGTGGTERMVIELCRRLPPRYQPVVCCLDQQGEWAHELTDCGVEVLALHRKPGFRPSLGVQLAKIARERHARLLHCHQYTPFVYGTLAGLLLPGSRLVFTEHGRLSATPPSQKRRMVNRVLTRAPAVLCAVSSELKSQMVAEGFPADRLHVVRNGIDLETVPSRSAREAARKELGIARDSIVVGTIARLDPVKDLGLLIRAFTLLHRAAPNTTLVIVGDGPERSRLVEEVQRAELSAVVRFTGQRDNARSLLPGFDLYANSSLSEGTSVTLLEAMACALPIVATDVGGTAEVVVHGDTGRLAPARSVAQFAHALRWLVGSASSRASMGASGRRRAEKKFGVQAMVRRYIAAYEGQRP